MKKRILAISLSLLFFGSITTSAVASTIQAGHEVAIVKKDDDDKDKKKAKTEAKAESKSEKSGECAAKKECCSKSSAEKSACNDKK